MPCLKDSNFISKFKKKLGDFCDSKFERNIAFMNMK